MKTSWSLFLFTCGVLAVMAYGRDGDWDYFTFAQTWPPGLCADAAREHHTCIIPAAIKDWTVHGLWPSKHNGESPFNCNSSWHFDIQKVATILADMKIHWPNLFNDTILESFWSHEWSKHGTCCTDLLATSNELNYFTTGLQMNRKFDIGSILADGGVIPTMGASYRYDDFITAVKRVTQFPPVIECAVKKLDNGSILHLIGQVEICLDKNFTPVSCYSDGYGSMDNGNFMHSDIVYETVDMKLRSAVDPLALKWRRRHRHAREPQSNCPLHQPIYYPPMHSSIVNMILS